MLRLWCPPSVGQDLWAIVGWCSLIGVRSVVRVRGIDEIPLWCLCIWCLYGCMCSGTSFATFVCTSGCIMFVWVGLNGEGGFVCCTDGIHVEEGSFKNVASSERFKDLEI